VSTSVGWLGLRLLGFLRSLLRLCLGLLWLRFSLLLLLLVRLRRLLGLSRHDDDSLKEITAAKERFGSRRFRCPGQRLKLRDQIQSTESKEGCPSVCVGWCFQSEPVQEE